MTDITNTDKLAALQNDRLLRKGGTYAALSDVYDPAPRLGRYAPQAGKVGPLPVANWAFDPAGLEPPLGYSFDAQEPCGELHEQREAARLLEARSAALPAEGGTASEAQTGARSNTVTATDAASPTSLRRRL